ncbi:MAG: hypothetical protein GY795_24225 [Desulfobacterales bacterium]|nr:hypothetical protein [Desulfobacterales bacterium]
MEKLQSAKGDKFDRKMLKPDTADYRFEKFFVLNYKTGQIEANPAASIFHKFQVSIIDKIYPFFYAVITCMKLIT